MGNRKGKREGKEEEKEGWRKKAAVMYLGVK